MINNRLIQQNNLLDSVLKVSNILKQRRPDLNTSIIPMLDKCQALLTKDNLSSNDLKWLDDVICGHLCHFKCLYDFCPLKPLDGESEQERWQRWGQILDQMKKQTSLICSSIKGKDYRKRLHE